MDPASLWVSRMAMPPVWRERAFCHAKKKRRGAIIHGAGERLTLTHLRRVYGRLLER